MPNNEQAISMVVLGSSELPTQWRLEAQSDRWLCPSQRPDPDRIWPSSSERKEDVFRKREKPTDGWVIWLQLGGSILYVIIFWSVKFNKSPFDNSARHLLWWESQSTWPQRKSLSLKRALERPRTPTLMTPAKWSIRCLSHFSCFILSQSIQVPFQVPLRGARSAFWKANMCISSPQSFLIFPCVSVIDDCSSPIHRTLQDSGDLIV